MSSLPLSKTIVIKPSPNSGKFFRDLGQTISNAEEKFMGRHVETNEEKVLETRPYEQQRFSGTIQIKRPKYSMYKRRWVLIDPEDLTKTKQLETNSEYLNDLVKKCRLKVDNPKHPDYNKPIESANIFDQTDPFFNHRKVKLHLTAGEAVISIKEEHPIEGIVVLCLMCQKEFQVGSARKGAKTGVQTRYIIVDRDVEQRDKKKSRKLDREARALYDKLSDKQKEKVALALGIINSVDLDSELIDDQLYDYITDGVTILKKKNITKQAHFVNTMERGTTFVNASYIFRHAKAKGIVRFMNKRYQAFGETLGDTEDSAIDFLSMNDNSEMLSRINEAIDKKEELND